MEKCEKPASKFFPIGARNFWGTTHKIIRSLLPHLQGTVNLEVRHMANESLAEFSPANLPALAIFVDNLWQTAQPVGSGTVATSVGKRGKNGHKGEIRKGIGPAEETRRRRECVRRHKKETTVSGHLCVDSSTARACFSFKPASLLRTVSHKKKRGATLSRLE